MIEEADFMAQLLAMVRDEKEKSYAQGLYDGLRMNSSGYLQMIQDAIHEVREYLAYEHGLDRDSQLVIDALERMQIRMTGNLAGEVNE